MSYATYNQLPITGFSQQIDAIAQEIYNPIDQYVDQITGCVGDNEYQYSVLMNAVTSRPVINQVQNTPITTTTQQRRFITYTDRLFTDYATVGQPYVVGGERFSKVAQLAVYDMHRQNAALFLNAIGGDALVGDLNSTNNTAKTTVPLPSSNIIPVDFGSSAPVGLTFAKVLEAIKILRQNHAYFGIGEKPVALINAALLVNLLLTTEITNSDYNKKVLNTGIIGDFLGVRFVDLENEAQVEIIDGVARNVCYVWMPSMVAKATWLPPTLSIVPDNSKDLNLLKLSYQWACNYARKQEAGVVKIICA